MAVKIVTDSTADLPTKLVSEYGIAVVPLNVHFGEEVLKDGVDIWPEEFYHRLEQGPLLPNTSQPAPGEFLTVYQKIAQPGDVIISIHISQNLSGTAGSAQVAADMMGKDYRVIVIDSRSVSMGLGLIVIKAAELAGKGAAPEVIVEQISNWQKQVMVYFTVNSLEHLQRTGRIGKASAFLGSLLNIKPLLGIVDGIIVPIEKIRGNFQKVAVEMVENLYQHFNDQPLALSIVHTEIPDAAQLLRKTAEPRLKIVRFFPSIIGPIVGAHAGPNTVGILAIPED
jgi:DegV family protein with EDD domain